MEKLQQNFDVAIRWRSFELRPQGSPPLPPEYLARIEKSRPMLQQRAREEYGLEINSGPMNTNSRPALILEKYAETQDKGPAFHDAAMHAYWQEARDISQPEVLQELAESVGLKIDDLQAILSTPEYDAAVTEDVELAQMYGLGGVPALVFADKYLVSGAQPYNVLKQVVEKVRAEQDEA